MKKTRWVLQIGKSRMGRWSIAFYWIWIGSGKKKEVWRWFISKSFTRWCKKQIMNTELHSEIGTEVNKEILKWNNEDAIGEECIHIYLRCFESDTKMNIRKKRYRKLIKCKMKSTENDSKIGSRRVKSANCVSWYRYCCRGGLLKGFMES